MNAAMAVPAPNRGWRLPHPYILGTALLATYYVGLLGPILPALAGALGGGALAIGLLFSTYSFAQFLTAPVLGAVGDRFGRRAVLLTSLAGALVGFGVFTLGVVSGAELWVLFLGWVIVGASDCWIATAFAWVADTTPALKRARSFAIVTGAIGLGFVLGPATSGLLGGANPALPLFVLLGLVAAAGLAGWYWMPESLAPSRRIESLSAGSLNPFKHLRDVLTFGRRLRLLIVGYFLLWPSVILLSSNLPTVLTDQGGWDPARISTVLITYGVIVVIVQLGVLPLLLRRFHPLHLAVVGAAMSALTFALFALFPAAGSDSLIYAGAVVFGLGQPLWQTCLTAAMSNEAPDEMQGRVQGSIASSMALAQVFGPFAVGALYAAAGPAVPYWTIAAVLLVGLGLVVSAKRDTPTTSAAEQPVKGLA